MPRGRTRKSFPYGSGVHQPGPPLNALVERYAGFGVRVSTGCPSVERGAQQDTVLEEQIHGRSVQAGNRGP